MGRVRGVRVSRARASAGAQAVVELPASWVSFSVAAVAVAVEGSVVITAVVAATEVAVAWEVGDRKSVV